MQYEVWQISGNVYIGTYDTRDEAKAVRHGTALHLGVFDSDFEIIEVCND
jgi:hypothetical protein